MRPAMVSDDKFAALMEQENAGSGREIEAALGMGARAVESGHDEFLHRLIALAIDAFRQELVSRRKVLELARKANLTEEAMPKLAALLKDIAREEGGDDLDPAVPRRRK